MSPFERSTREGGRQRLAPAVVDPATLLVPMALLALAVLLAACPGGEAPPAAEEAAELTAAGGHDGHEEHREGLVELTPEAARRAGIRTAAAEMRTLDPEIATTGRVDFDQTRLAHVSSRVSGRVGEVRAALGDTVRAGEVMAAIDSVELGRAKAEFLQARAREELARETLEREEKLHAERISSEQEFLSARAAHREALAALGTLEETLHLYGLGQAEVESLHYDDPRASLFLVRAPFAGRVVDKHATLGELVTPERELFTVADLSRVWVWIDVFERDLARVHLDDQVEVRVETWPEEIFRGRVSYIAAQVDPDTRAARARIHADNAERHLRPGMFARVRLIDPHRAGGAPAEPTLAVPEGAVLRDGGAAIVFVPRSEASFERRPVETGRRSAGWVEILGGLALGEEVVVEGGFVLKSESSRDRLGEGHAH